jgi:dynein heavy chain
MDTVNSLLTNGECVHLFSNDEIDGLYQAVGPAIKRDYPNFIIDPKKYFNHRVRKNLHICLAISPYSSVYDRIVRSYTNIISNSHMYWIRDWLDDYLLNEAKYFMRNRFDPSSSSSPSSDLNDRLSQTIFEIHSFMLKECKQLNWAGNMEKELKITHTKIIEKKKEQIQKTYTVSVPNWPYSKSILQEQIRYCQIVDFL